MLGGDLYEHIKIIFLHCPIRPLKPAETALVYNSVFFIFHFHSCRFHHSATCFQCRPVARVHIHMPRPQALRTMIRIAISYHFKPALPAGKIFDGAFELGGHKKWRLGAGSFFLNFDSSPLIKIQNGNLRYSLVRA